MIDQVPLPPRSEPLPARPESRPLPAAPCLALRGISKRWRGLANPVLDDVSLDLAPGELVWLGGRNGAGKTTLLRIAAGLIRPDAGTVHALGSDAEQDKRPFYRTVGFLSAGNSGLYARLTAGQHLDLVARIAFLPPAERDRSVTAAVERFALAELVSRRVDRLSMGQRQRVRLALAFLHDPRVILLDEPRNSLDPEGADLLVSAIERVTAAGGAALWVSPLGEDLGIRPARRFLVADGRLSTP